MLHSPPRSHSVAGQPSPVQAQCKRGQAGRWCLVPAAGLGRARAELPRREGGAPSGTSAAGGKGALVTAPKGEGPGRAAGRLCGGR